MKKLLSTCILLFVIAIFSLTAQTKVYAPTLLVPENGDLKQMPNVTISWSPVTGVHGLVFYDVELDTDPGFSSPTTFNTNLSAVVTSELTFNGVYYWRVKAIDGPDISDWSETWSFQVDNILGLWKPNDNKVDVPPAQLLEWYTITGVTHYDIQLDTSFFWKPLPDSTGMQLNDCYFTSGLEGWMVGAGGTLVNVDSFKVMEYASPSTSDLFGVALAAADDGIAVGAAGTILYYDGTEWTEETNSPTILNLYDVAFVNNTNAWVVSDSGYIFHYNGVQWDTTNLPTSKPLFDVSFVDANTGVTVGGGGKVYHYDGLSWTEKSAGTKDLYGVHLLSANMAYACGKGGVVWMYDGTEWTEMETPSGTKDLNSIYFTGAGTGYSIGKDGYFLQYAGEWFNQSIGSENQFNSIFFSGGVGYTCGNDGEALYDDGEGFSSDHNVHSRIADSGAYMTQYMYFGKKYYWRVRARHAQDTSDWSGARSLNTIATVTLVSPDNNETSIGLSDEFTWKAIDGVLTYEAQFADNEHFSNPYNEFTEENSLIRNNLFFGTDYYWRVRANHATDTSEWSEPWHFNTINTVNLSSPANDATDVEILPTLVWEPITGVDSYQVSYDTMDLTHPCCDVLVEAPESEYRVITPMVNGTTYQWHVRSIHGADTTEWSEPWSFTIEPVQGLNEVLDDNMLNLYPNPSNGNIYIEYETMEATEMKVYVVDLVGQTMIQQELFFNKGKTAHSLDLSTLPNGIYIVRYTNGDQSYSRKITLNK